MRLAALLAAFVVAACDGGGQAGAPPISRMEFSDRCRTGKQIEACVYHVGKPDRTQGSTSGTEYWYFSGRTYDPVTSRRDRSAQVVVEHGVVTGINFR